MSTPGGVSETMTSSTGCSDVSLKKPKLVKLSQVMLVGNKYRKQFGLPLLPFFQNPDMKIKEIKDGKKKLLRISPRHTK